MTRAYQSDVGSEEEQMFRWKTADLSWMNESTNNILVLNLVLNLALNLAFNFDKR